jgi:hypothetical protein
MLNSNWIGQGPYAAAPPSASALMRFLHRLLLPVPLPPRPPLALPPPPSSASSDHAHSVTVLNNSDYFGPTLKSIQLRKSYSKVFDTCVSLKTAHTKKRFFHSEFARSLQNLHMPWALWSLCKYQLQYISIILLDMEGEFGTRSLECFTPSDPSALPWVPR